MTEMRDTMLRTLKKCSYVMGVTVTLRVRMVPPIGVGYRTVELASAKQPLDRSSVVRAQLFCER